jgi:hypothetical protein
MADGDRDGDEATLWGALIASAAPRKHAVTRTSSPLAGVAKEEVGGLGRGGTGHVRIDTINPALLEPQPQSTCQQAVDAFKGIVSRRRYRKGKVSRRGGGESKYSVFSVDQSVVRGEEQQGMLNESELLGEIDDLEGLAPLVRVQSRGSLSCSV